MMGIREWFMLTFILKCDYCRKRFNNENEINPVFISAERFLRICPNCNKKFEKGEISNWDLAKKSGRVNCNIDKNEVEQVSKKLHEFYNGDYDNIKDDVKDMIEEMLNLEILIYEID